MRREYARLIKSGEWKARDQNPKERKAFMHFEDKRHFVCKVSELLNKDGIFCLSIDKNPSGSIDMGHYKLKIYPDKIDDIVIVEYVDATDLHISDRFETEYAHVIICSK